MRCASRNWMRGWSRWPAPRACSRAAAAAALAQTKASRRRAWCCCPFGNGAPPSPSAPFLPPTQVLLYAQLRGNNQGVIKITTGGMNRAAAAGKMQVRLLCLIHCAGSGMTSTSSSNIDLPLASSSHPPMSTPPPKKQRSRRRRASPPSSTATARPACWCSRAPRRWRWPRRRSTGLGSWGRTTQQRARGRWVTMPKRWADPRAVARCRTLCMLTHAARTRSPTTG